jgi:hypothetical protein
MLELKESIMDWPAPVEGIRAATDLASFLDACGRAASRAAEPVLGGPEAVGLAALAASASPIPWNRFLCTDGLDPRSPRAAFELAFNAALNGGYFEEKGGSVVQWESGGSGSQALAEWIAKLGRLGCLPGIDIGEEAASARLAPLVEGQPHAAHRLRICLEFADPARRSAHEALLEGCRSGAAWRFDLAAVDQLVGLYPSGFGSDPFRKKACLAFLMLSTSLRAAGAEVSYELPIPSDYQIPRILAWKGLIRVSDGLKAMLTSGKLIDVQSEEVTAFRAAAVVVAHEIGRIARRDDDIVDGALFGTFRKDPAFVAGALPPMRCASLWF